MTIDAVTHVVPTAARHALQPSTSAPQAARQQSPVRRTGYQGFGSFHSGNVEELIHVPAGVYEAPPLPFELDRSSEEGLDDNTPLGGDEMRALFSIDFAKWTFINHGAFGGVCLPAYREAELWRKHCETQPLRFLDRELFPQMVRVMREVASYINAQPQDLVLLPNATTGLNVVLHSVLSPGDTVYVLDIGYASVRKMALARVATLAVGEVTFPLSGPSDIVDLVSRTCPAGAKLAVFDAVTSNTAVVLPIAELVRVCHAKGVPVLIDAAHALLQTELDVASLGADFVVANCHKWLAGPRGSALMWVASHQQARVQPLIVSHGSGAGFVSDFIWDGCRDYAPLLGVSSALRLWRRLGCGRVRQYMYRLRDEASRLLTSRWDTDLLTPPAMCAAMALVRLPQRLSCGAESTSEDAKYIQDVLHYDHGIEVPVKCVHGRLYVRISAHVYNRLHDYHVLADVVCALLDADATDAVADKRRRVA